MKVKVKFTNEDTKALYLKASKKIYAFPFKTHEDDFCYDVVATSCEEVAPNVYKYGLGLAFQIERGQELICEYKKDPLNSEHIWFDTWASKIKLSIDFRPRSSVWKTGMLLSNCQGTVN